MSEEKKMGFAEWVGRIVLFPLSWIEQAAVEGRKKREAAEEAAREQERQRELAEQRESDRQKRLEQEEQERIQEAEQQKSLAKAENARYECQLLYDRYQYKIGEKFTQEKLDKYFADFMKDEFSSEIIEKRARDLCEMIMSFVDEPQNKLTTRVEIKAFYDKERQDAQAANLPQDVLEATIAELNSREDQAMMDLLDRQ